MDAGTSDTKVYIILRGSVRVFSEVLDENTRRSSFFYVEDLTSGEVFGEAALGGIFKRNITVVATNLCDIAILDSQDYLHVLEGGSRKLIIDEKTQFLSKVPLFKHSDFYRKFELAHALSQCEFERGQVILEKGKKSKSLMFLMNGRVDFVAAASPIGRQVVSSTEKFSYIGESGILQAKYKSKVFIEAFTGVASSRVECLFLPETHYHVIESHLLDQMRSTFFSKRWFRLERRNDLRGEYRRQQEQDLLIISNHDEKPRTAKTMPNRNLSTLTDSKSVSIQAHSQGQLQALESSLRPTTSLPSPESRKSFNFRPHTAASLIPMTSSSTREKLCNFTGAHDSSDTLIEILEEMPRMFNL